MGVDVAGFSSSRRSNATRAQMVRHCGGGDSTRLLFYAGRLSPEKNLGLLVDALRHLAMDRGADYRLVVAGEGPRAEWLRAQAVGELQGRIWLCGNLDREVLAAYYASCDVFVHPNPREPFGIGPLEAMASGVPVVVPSSGGVLTYASPRNAWVAAPKAPAFAGAIRAAIAGDPDRMRLARATVEEFRWDAATRRYFDLYDDIHRRVIAPRSSAESGTRPGLTPSQSAVESCL
jgi:alpha-1,6-mannosyltransferase